MSDKPPYKLTIKLNGTRPDALNAAVRRLDDLCSEYDQVADLKTAITIESWKEDDLLAIREGIEAFLDAKRLIIGGEVTLTSPVVRKRTPVAVPTPMDELLAAQEQEAIITPIVAEPLQLAAPVDAEEGTFSILEDSGETIEEAA